MSAAHRRTSGAAARQYPRTARLNQLLQEIIADELERIDDDRLELVTVISVTVEPDLRHATVYVDSPQGPDQDAEVLEALGEHRVRLQAAVGRQARTKRTPELHFRPDEVERSAARVEEIMRHLHEGEDEPGGAGAGRADA
jgi:ribosome-binding factor A